jgi:hypothetical protein
MERVKRLLGDADRLDEAELRKRVREVLADEEPERWNGRFTDGCATCGDPDHTTAACTRCQWCKHAERGHTKKCFVCRNCGSSGWHYTDETRQRYKCAAERAPPTLAQREAYMRVAADYSAKRAATTDDPPFQSITVYLGGSERQQRGAPFMEASGHKDEALLDAATDELQRQGVPYRMRAGYAD